MTEKKEKKEQCGFRRYSPQLDQIIEAESKKKWEDKVKKLLADNNKD